MYKTKLVIRSLFKILLKLSMFSSLALVLALEIPGAAIPDSNPAASNSFTQKQSNDTTKSKVLQTYAKLPLSFEVNQGQTDRQVNFLARGNGYSVFLTPTEAVLSLHQTKSQRLTSMLRPAVKQPPSQSHNILRLQLVASNPTPQVKGLKRLPGKSNYLTGKDSSKWHTDITHYAKVQYQAVYPGIDLVYYGNQGQLEYDFVVAPHANVQNIRFRVVGASRLELDRRGNLVLHAPNGVFRQYRPIVYQEINGQKKAIAGSYVLLGKQEVGFKVAAYDQTQRLVIDPVLSYSTYLGGSSEDINRAIAVDLQGNVYVTGVTFSSDFPTKNAYNSVLGSGLFVTKLNPNVSGQASLVYSTYIANGQIESNGIAADYQGNVYLTGVTYSNDFPTTENAFARNLSNFSDAFVTKLNATGNSLLYSTYLGGSGGNGADFGNALALDARGNVYIAGDTNSTDFPTKNAFDSTFNGNLNAFVAKLNPNLSGASSLVYSSYLSGSQFDGGYGIATDLQGNAYVTGVTFSSDFPLKNAFDNTFIGEVNDSEAYVTKVNPSASGAASLVYSSYLGGSGSDFGRAIAVDVRGNAYVTGETQSNDFPIKNAFDSSLEGGQDAFVTKVNPSASGSRSLVYSTYLGGNSSEQGFGIKVDLQGNAYVAGGTNSVNFPIKNALDSTLNGINDVFVTKLNAGGNSLFYSSYLGGNSFDNVYAIAVDLRGNVYVTGQTFSSDFPTKNAFDNSLSGSNDGFITKISP
jgi:hypothetical protein